MNISIKTIPHNEQRYETCGDWFYDMEGLQIRVSDLGNHRYNFLVLFHELVEAFLCREALIDEQAITEFDKNFEANREEGNTDEPGDSILAPYWRQHQIATGLERLMAAILFVDWKLYEEVVNAL